MDSMRRLLVLAGSVLALATGASAGAPEPLFATERRLGGGITIVRLDWATLKPLAGQRIDAGYASHVLARSPDGRYLAVTGSNVIRVLDLRTRKATRPLHPAGWVPAALWTRATAFVAVTQDEVLLVDARRNSLTRRIELPGHVLATARGTNSLVLLLAPPDDIGQLSIATVDGAGTVRAKQIPMRGGWRTLRNEERNSVGARREAPGLAVDATGTRAVVAGRSTIATIDLADLSSETIAVQSRNLQKTSEGWERSALWLDAAHVATFGADYNGERRPTIAPLQIVDLRDGGARILDTDASYATRAGSLLVAIGEEVSVFEADGTLRYRALGERRRGPVIALDDNRLYADTSGRNTSWVVLDASDGKVLARRTFARPTYIVSLP